MIDRFTLFVIFRSQVSDRDVRRQALVLEDAMVALAPGAGVDPTLAGLAGLGARIDLRLTEHNARRRGLVAEELLRTEGVAPLVVEAVRDCYQVADVAALSPLAALLAGVDGVLDRVWAVRADGDDLDADGIAIGLERAGRRRKEPAAARALDALAAVGVGAADAVAAVMVAAAATEG